MENLWTRCNTCPRILYKQDILENNYVCPSCNFHFRISARERLEILFDEGKFELLDEGIFPVDALHFEDTRKYSERLEENQKKTGLAEAVLNARGKIGGAERVVSGPGVSFLGGRLGSGGGGKK